MAEYDSVAALGSPPTPDFIGSGAVGVNASGEVAGYAYMPESTPIRWSTGGSPTVIPVINQNLPGTAAAVALNAAGDTVGWRPEPTFSPGQGFLYRGGTVVDLEPIFDQTVSVAVDVNDAGVLVGSAGELGALRPYSWDSVAAGPAVDLGLLPGHEGGVARAINANGWIVGHTSSPGSVPSHLWAWDPTNGLRDLGPGLDSADINDAGLVLGRHNVPGGGVGGVDSRGFLIDLNDPSLTREDLGLIPVAGYTECVPIGMNNAGDVIGQCLKELGQGAQEPRVFLKRFGEPMEDLNALIPSGTGWTLRFGGDINDDGTVVGVGRLNGVNRAFRASMDLAEPDPPPGPKFEFHRADLPTLVAQVLIGLTHGGNGVIILPGSGPVPVDPAPFRDWARQSPQTRDAIVGLAIHEAATAMGDPRSRAALQRASLQSVREAVDRRLEELTR